MKNNIPKPETDNGMNLLLIFLMFLMSVLAVLGNGGVLSSCELFSANYFTAWSGEIAAFCTYDSLFLLIGFVMVNRKFEPHKIIVLWVQIVFYGLLIVGCISLMSGSVLNFSSWKNAFLPVVSYNYWLITFCFGVLAFSPFFNYIINKMNRKYLSFIILFSLLLFSVILPFLDDDNFKINHGYSFAWFALLYLIGGYCKKYNVAEKIKAPKLILMLIVSLIITCAGKFAVDYYNVKIFSIDISSDADRISDVSSKFFIENIFLQHTFPTVLFSSVILLLLVSRLKINKPVIKEKLNSYAPLVLAVYFILNNKLVADGILKGLFEIYASFNPVLTVLCVVGTAVAILLICMMLDLIRSELFRILKIEKLCGKVTQFFMSKVSSKCEMSSISVK